MSYPRALILVFCSLLLASLLQAQDAAKGRQQFESRCAACHGANGQGGEMGPSIIRRIASRTDSQLAATINNGLPGGMPAFHLNESDVNQLIAFLHTLRSRRGFIPVRGKVQTTTGQTLEGVILNESSSDMQLRTDDGQIHLLRREGDRFRPVTSGQDWPTYNGKPTGNRYSSLDQINRRNVARLAPKWVFSIADNARLEVTPVVSGGLMFVTSANECYALDAGSGREVWHFQRPRTQGLTGNAAGGINRGVAVAGDRVFMVTDNAHIIALNRSTGELIWESVMADWHVNYNATSAPLAVGDLVVSGTAGGDEGARGFIAAYDQKTGKEVWRFWTVPAPGQPGSETWEGPGVQHPGAVAWFTGSYDAELDTLYWQTGNPGNDFNGSARGGDNLYSCSILALDPKTGHLKWHYQFTPHDVYDWDATEPAVLVDTAWHGQQRKLLLQANRNGFFYVLDRTNGKLLLAKPFVHKLTWASEIGENGRPVLNPNQEKTPQGTKVCPSVGGASNWYSTSFNPATGLYYVQTQEECSIIQPREQEWQAGRGYRGGSARPVPQEQGQRILRAIDPQTGKIVWELPQVGPADSWGGVLSTAGGLVFFCDDSGSVAAADVSTGKPLWSFQTNHSIRASPMTYTFDGKQYIAAASGSNILAFALVN
ncbi:MAG TPA: PQQ-dependent dehydrogenase, methanol/ethanol family [Bryobacteraceae bacterium]|nr:PQQ-dependent dehydrogenase, methanol/ethanol family [Bryobacteraceae bacterium]